MHGSDPLPPLAPLYVERGGAVPLRGSIMQSATPTRRTVLKTAAWTVPLVSVAGASPAYAVSTAVNCAVTHTFDFTPFVSPTSPGHPAPIEHTSTTSVTQASWSVASTPTLGTAPLEPGATLAQSTMTISTRMTSGRLRYSESTNNNAPNGHFRFTSLGQTASVAGNDTRPHMLASGPALKFATDTASSPTADFPTMEIVLTFDTPVTDLSFLLTDIDSNGSNQIDRIQIRAVRNGTAVVPFSVAYPNVTTAHPAAFSRPTPVNESTQWLGSSSVSDNQTGGNMRVTTQSGTPVTRLEIIFENTSAQSGQRNNSINLANVSYRSEQKVCVPAT